MIPILKTKNFKTINGSTLSSFTAYHSIKNPKESSFMTNTKANDIKADGIVTLDLFTATELGNLEELKWFISAGANVNVKTVYRKHTPLHLSILHNHLKCFYELIKSGADISIPDAEGNSPLYLSLNNIDTPIYFDELVEAGVDIHIKNNHGFTPLHQAALVDNADCLLKLITRGADVNAKDKKGMTPLHVAAMNGHQKCLHYLFEFGANPSVFDLRHFTAKNLALEYGRKTCADFITHFELIQTEKTLINSDTQHIYDSHTQKRKTLKL